ncbi:hypothetical protein [Agromyces silvae]|uniref:hypothetical protein n=1 Tax=Agromyces silvae TaxID=3388266 RepID=UPI00280BF03B|nr:hypothetical protein [Agromyces protaetiae]
MSTSSAPQRTASVVPGAAFPREGRVISLVTDRLAGSAAVVAGVLSLATGIVQALVPQTVSDTIDPHVRVILAGFTISLWALAVMYLGLARHARSSWGAVVAAIGTTLLTVGTISSAVNGADLEFFPAVAMAANGLWLIGGIALCVSLIRARRVSVWVALPLPLLQLPLLFFSQLGGGTVAGLYLLALGVILLTGRIASRAHRTAR